MRRSDREITDFQEIFQVLERCQTVRLGLRDGDAAYVVPVSFGCAVENGRIAVYFHGAKDGKKHGLLAQNPRVCVEADRLLRYVQTEHGITADYESVIGCGTAQRVDGEAAVRGLELLLRHCGFPTDSAEGCAARNITWVYRIELEQLTGKRRFSQK